MTPETGRPGSARASRRTVVHDEVPRPLLHKMSKDGVFAIVHGHSMPGFLVTCRDEVVHWIMGDDLSFTSEVVPLLLEYYSTEDREDTDDWSVWSGFKLLAIVRALADGRRLIITFDGPRVTRDIYPPPVR